jgi:hypothetical protein
MPPAELFIDGDHETPVGKIAGGGEARGPAPMIATFRLRCGCFSCGI